MSIYSMGDRYRSVSIDSLPANENYTEISDLNLIMYESALNDQTFFESILACDLYEVVNTKNGTMLEAEISRFNKENIVKIVDKLKERLRQFWMKIKSVFDSVIQWISAYVIRDGKAFAKEFRKKFQGKFYKDSFEGTLPTDYNIEIPKPNRIVEKIDSYKLKEGKLKSQDIIKKELGTLLGMDSCTPKDYIKTVSEKCFRKGTISKNNIDEFLVTLESSKETIKNLLEQKKNSLKTIKEIEYLIKNGEKDPSKLENVTVAVSAYETIISCTTKAAITFSKTKVKLARKYLQKILSSASSENKEDKVNSEFALITEMDVFDEPHTDMLDDETKEKVKDYIDELETEVSVESAWY